VIAEKISQHALLGLPVGQQLRLEQDHDRRKDQKARVKHGRTPVKFDKLQQGIFGRQRTIEIKQSDILFQSREGLKL
jgi:hypothetical protein